MVRDKQHLSRPFKEPGCAPVKILVDYLPYPVVGCSQFSKQSHFLTFPFAKPSRLIHRRFAPVVFRNQT